MVRIGMSALAALGLATLAAPPSASAQEKYNPKPVNGAIAIDLQAAHSSIWEDPAASEAMRSPQHAVMAEVAFGEARRDTSYASTIGFMLNSADDAETLRIVFIDVPDDPNIRLKVDRISSTHEPKTKELGAFTTDLPKTAAFKARFMITAEHLLAFGINGHETSFPVDFTPDKLIVLAVGEKGSVNLAVSTAGSDGYSAVFDKKLVFDNSMGRGSFATSPVLDEAIHSRSSLLGATVSFSEIRQDKDHASAVVFEFFDKEKKNSFLFTVKPSEKDGRYEVIAQVKREDNRGPRARLLLTRTRLNETMPMWFDLSTHGNISITTGDVLDRIQTTLKGYFNVESARVLTTGGRGTVELQPKP